MIERTQSLAAADECYLQECIFRGTWGERLRRYMNAWDFAGLTRLCDPADELCAPSPGFSAGPAMAFRSFILQ